MNNAEKLLLTCIAWLSFACALSACSNGRSPESQAPDGQDLITRLLGSGLGDSSAKSIIESEFNKPGEFAMSSGNVRFMGGITGHKPNYSKGEDDASEFPLYRAFAAMGYIAIIDERDLSRGRGGWDDFFELSQKGVRRTAQVAITDLGRQNGEVVKRGEIEKLLVRVGTSKVETIVSDDPFEFGVDKYRVVQGTHTYDIPNDLAAAYAEARPQSADLGRERRFKVLLKYDPFEKKWELLEANIGPRAGDFRSNSVDRTLANLKRCGSVSCE